MKGLPVVFQTKQDWVNGFDYAVASSDVTVKQQMVTRLEGLAASRTCLVLKKTCTKLAEEQTSADFDSVVDPASAFAVAGFSQAEITAMIKGLAA